MKTPEENFLGKIKDFTEAKALYEQIIERFDKYVHHTNTGGGDLRIKVNNRNVFTMSWQPRDGHFLCRAYCQADSHKHDLEKLRELNIMARESKSSDEPLQIEFDYTPDGSNEKFLTSIDMAISNWVNK